MQFMEQRFVGQSRQSVWRALMDPQILQACINDCQSISQHSRTHYELLLVRRIGPVGMKLKADMHLTNVEEPYSYTMSGRGRGPLASAVHGSADIALTEEEGDHGVGTLITYTIDLSLAGRAAKFGSGLASGTVKTVANGFFDRLAQLME